MGRALAFVVLVSAILFGTASPAVSCELPKGLYEKRKQVTPLSPEENQIDRTFVEFMTSVAKLYVDGRRESAESCCEKAKEDLVGFEFCALVRYLQSKKADVRSFVSAMPENDQQLEAVWMMERISAGGTFETPTALPGIPLPSGLTLKFVDELFALMKAGNVEAARKYMFAYDRADGEWGEHMDEQLPKLFKTHPTQVVKLWPVLRQHTERLKTMLGFISTGEVQAISHKYSGLCKAGDARCGEIVSLFSVQ